MLVQNDDAEDDDEGMANVCMMANTVSNALNASIIMTNDRHSVRCVRLFGSLVADLIIGLNVSLC